MPTVRVLLVANTTTFSAIGVELMQAGCAVATAQNTNDALAQLAVNIYDAVLLDNASPDASVAFITQLHQLSLDAAPILVVPEHNSAAIEAGLQAGAYDVLTSPLHLPLMLAALNRAAERRQLREQQRSAPTSETSWSVLHAINNQLSGILGIAQLYMTDTTLPAELREDFASIEEAARRIRSLLQPDQPPSS